MTIKSTGAISISDIVTELSLGSNTLKSLNDTDIRGLLGKASGTISLGDAYGKALASVIGGSFTAAYSATNKVTGWSSTLVSGVSGLPNNGLGTSSSQYLNGPNGMKIYAIVTMPVYSSFMYNLFSDVKVPSFTLHINIPGYGNVLYTFTYHSDVGVDPGRYYYMVDSPVIKYGISANQVITVSA